MGPSRREVTRAIRAQRNTDKYLAATTENAAGNIPDFKLKVYHPGKVIDCDKRRVSLLIRSLCGLAGFRQNVKTNIYATIKNPLRGLSRMFIVESEGMFQHAVTFRMDKRPLLW